MDATGSLGLDRLMDDRVALRRFVSEGDPDAFGVLCLRYESMVYATCLRVLGSEDEARDAAQDTFLKLAHRAGSIRSNVGGWLHSAAMGCSVDLIRRAGAQRRAEGVAARRGDVSGGGGADAGWSEIEPELDGALSALGDSDRELLVARYLCGRAQREIAGELGVSEGTVSRRLDRALGALRVELGKRGVGVGGSTALALVLGSIPVVVAPMAVRESAMKISLTGAAVRAGSGARSGVGSLVGAALVGVVLVGGLVFAVRPGMLGGIGGSGSVLSGVSAEPGPDRPEGEIGPFVVVSAGERNFFDRGVWIRDARIVINHGIDPKSGDVNSSTLEIVDRERGDDGVVVFTTRVREIRPIGVEFSRFELGGEVRIRASFDDVGRLVLEPLTEGVQLGANEPRWFGVRPPLGWEERARIPDDAGEDGLLGPWTEAERIPVRIDAREILYGTSTWKAAVFRIVSWERREGYSRIESIHAGGRNPYLIGTRFRLILREDEGGYTMAYFPRGAGMGDRWPTGFEYSVENPVHVVSFKDRP